MSGAGGALRAGTLPRIIDPSTRHLKAAWDLGTVEHVVDLTMLPQRDRVVLVTLQDGRQLEGALLARTDYFEIAGTVFYEWEVEELDDVT